MTLACQTDPNTALSVGTATGQTHAVPPLPPSLSAYRYAYDNAFVALPSVCAEMNRLAPNWAGRSRAQRSWVGRLFELPALFDFNCGCGVVVFAHGSSGMIGDGWRYLGMFASHGYVVIAPDSMAGAELGLRSRKPVDALSEAVRAEEAAGVESFWCANNVYTSECEPLTNGGPAACYSSSAANILADRSGWASYYERIFEIRRRELAETFRLLPRPVRLAPKVFLAGASEGGMVAARFPESESHGVPLSGRIVLQWSCEPNYYMSCNEKRPPLCAGECAPSTPVLSVISERDPFFSAELNSSIASVVAAAEGGAPKLRGSCYAGMRAQGLSHAVSVVLPQHLLPAHGLGSASPNLVHALLGGFLRAPDTARQMAALAAEAGLCRLRAGGKAGVAEYECNELGSEPLVAPPGECSWAAELVHLTNYEMGSREWCALPPLGTRHAGAVSAPTVAAVICAAALAGCFFALAMSALISRCLERQRRTLGAGRAHAAAQLEDIHPA